MKTQLFAAVPRVLLDGSMIALHTPDLLPLKTETPAPPQHVPDHLRTLLNAVRLTALMCRSAARSDLFEACAVLSLQRTVAQDAYVTALVNGLGTGLSKVPKFFRPGVADLTFDEKWLVGALACCETGDWDSLDFLLRRRIAPAYRRNIAFLLRGILWHR